VKGSIQNKVVAVTGASSGIGEASARILARAGAKIVLGARRVDRLEQIVAEIKASGGEAIACSLDVTQREDVKGFVDTAVKEFGRLDVLVNNAGVMLVGPLDELKVDEWDRMIDVNIKGVLYGIAAALPVMRAQNSGHVINVSSVAGHRVGPGSSVYSGTKWAVRAISEGFRQEASASIRSTIISPGAVLTELPDHISSPTIKEAAKAMYSTAIGADAIANAILYAIEQPAEVDINEILIRPTAQQT
jgi:NADP-dependent 3-hydroxy acid dehydrogenase YdfG